MGVRIPRLWGCREGTQAPPVSCILQFAAKLSVQESLLRSDQRTRKAWRHALLEKRDGVQRTKRKDEKENFRFIVNVMLLVYRVISGPNQDSNKARSYQRDFRHV